MGGVNPARYILSASHWGDEVEAVSIVQRGLHALRECGCVIAV